MDDLEEEIADAMAKAYDNTSLREHAIKLVKEKFPAVDSQLLSAMWYAIDAYNVR